MRVSKSVSTLISISLTMIAAISLSIPALAAVTSFSDVPASHSFHDAIMECASQGIVGGYDDGTFRPANTVTRSNFSVMLSRAFYAADVAINQTMPLYTEQGTFYPNFMALLVHGVYSGTDMASKTQLQNTAIMNTGINRYEMAQMMTNIMKNNGFAASDAEKSAVQSKIADYNSIPSQFQDAVTNVYALGIIGGYADGSFSGSGIMNRGQACTVIYRMMQYSGNTGSGSGSVATPVPEVPAEPVAVTTGKLSDGSEATEANVMRLLEQAYQAKAGKAWGTPTNANGTSNNDAYPAGITSALYATITNGPRKDYYNNLPVSVQSGCGGFAAYISDYVFGQKAAVRETTLDKMRAGDVIAYLTDNKLTHIAVYCGHSGPAYDIYGEERIGYGTYDATAGAKPMHGNPNENFTPNNGIMQANSTTGKSYVIYTRYPDSSSGGTSSGSVTTPVPETPAPAEPVATTAGTLSDGSEATEANVMRLLEKAYQAKAGTAWGNSAGTDNPYEDGSKSALYLTITFGSRKDYKTGLSVSVRTGCGGYAAYLSDYVFGQNATVRETTLDKMRAGDVIVDIVDNKITHIEVYCGHSGIGGDIYGNEVTAYGTYGTTAGVLPTHGSPSASFSPNNGIIKANSTTGQSYVIYTRYPN